MNKKGITLIEIIISLVLITVIGTTSIVVLNASKDVNLSKIENIVLEAAEVYISLEKDELGKPYEEGIIKGGEGVIIPLNNLVDKGYISNKDYKLLIDEIDDNKEYVIVGFKSDEECKGGTSITAGWVDATTYICGFGDIKKNNENSIYNKIINLDYQTECRNSLCFYNNGKDYVDESENGETSVWYFQGNVDNNYLKFEGLDSKTFRIVRTVENNNIKIVDNDRFYSGLGSDRDYIAPQYWPNSGDYINMSGHKIDSYNNRYARGTDYSCDENDNVTSWFDSTPVKCIGDDASHTERYVTSIYYDYIYKPLENEYNNIKSTIEPYIEKDYKWCFSENIAGKEFKCSTNKTNAMDFGLLTLGEYSKMTYVDIGDSQSITLKDYRSLNFYRLTSNHKLYLYGFETASGFACDVNKEAVAFDGYLFYNTFKLISDGSWCNVSENGYLQTSYKVYLRPAYVIKGTSKVVRGDGTKDNPYIISGLY